MIHIIYRYQPFNTYLSSLINGRHTRTHTHTHTYIGGASCWPEIYIHDVRNQQLIEGECLFAERRVIGKHARVRRRYNRSLLFTLGYSARDSGPRGTRRREISARIFRSDHARVCSKDPNRDREIDHRRWSSWLWSSPSRSPRATRPRSWIAPMIPPGPRISVTGEWKYNTRTSERSERDRCSFLLHFAIETQALRSNRCFFFKKCKFLSPLMRYSISLISKDIQRESTNAKYIQSVYQSLQLFLLAWSLMKRRSSSIVQIISKPLWASNVFLNDKANLQRVGVN